ncbi:MAG: post-COAP-1 domain-containing protein, partial [Euryarchaeota archaeon]|nr:post-COAP-1 domain-containing protein [Euryarchaeota archaeon]
MTDSYNVMLNGTWTNGTEATFMNVSVSPCDWANITVFAYNASGTGTLSAGSVSDNVQAPCDITPPVITITTPVPYGLYTVGMTLNFSATDSGSGVATIAGNLTNTIDVSQNVDSGFAPAVGAYTLVVTATDNASNTNVSDPVFFVVYDPNGGHATGGGWFYPDENSTLPGGKANFGFTAKYKDNSSTGKLNFQYSDAGIHLKSTSIDWLTISSVSAQFQGNGTINDDGLYTFKVHAKDNGEPGADTDHFDIKIWNGTDTEADPYHKAKNTIAGGNIEV